MALFTARHVWDLMGGLNLRGEAELQKAETSSTPSHMLSPVPHAVVKTFLPTVPTAL